MGIEPTESAYETVEQATAQPRYGAGIAPIAQAKPNPSKSSKSIMPAALVMQLVVPAPGVGPAVGHAS